MGDTTSHCDAVPLPPPDEAWAADNWTDNTDPLPAIGAPQPAEVRETGGANGKQTSAPEDVTGLRVALMDNGWVPVPVTSPDYVHPDVMKPGKQPFFKGWNKISADTLTTDLIRSWEAIADHSNTGLKCGDLLGLDLDIPDKLLAPQIAALADALLGPPKLVRVGAAPKTLRCYRHERPLAKRETPEFFLPDGTKCQVEAMGTGQQVVGFGTHPDTRQPYEWLGASPLDTPFDTLPGVTEDKLLAFLTAAEDVIRAAGGRTQKEIDAAAAKANVSDDTDRPATAEPALNTVIADATSNAGETFFRKVNNAALADIGAWVKRLFLTAVYQPKTGAYRISSKNLGRDYQEDLSIHPDGIQDFGPRKGLTPIDLVIKFGGAPDAVQAAHTLCEWLGRIPADLGWLEPTAKGTAQTAAAAGVALPEVTQETLEADIVRAKVAADAVAKFLDEFNTKYMVVSEAGRTVIYVPTFSPILHRRGFDRMTFEDLRNLYLNRSVVTGHKDGKLTYGNAAVFWLRHKNRRQFVNGVTFDPSGKSEDGVLNLWQGFAVARAQGDWSLMKRHIWDVICDKDPLRYTYLYNWLARLFQYPAQQGEVAIVMKGKEGCGKGILARAVLYIVGPHGLQVSNAKHLIGNFNGHLRDAVLLFADEAFFAGDRQHVGVLKSIITEPYLAIEAKYKNAIQTPNFLHLLMASNEEWVIPASIEARRFLMLLVSDHRIGDHAYFKAIQEQLETGGYEAMLFDLLKHDISAFSVRNVPKTEGLQQQQKLSLDTTNAWWADVLHRGYVFKSKLGLEDYFAVWQDEVATELLYASYTEYAKARHERHPFSRENFGKAMVAFGAKATRPHNPVTGEHITDVETGSGGTIRKATLIRPARAYAYAIGILETARDAFTKATGLEFNWQADDSDGTV